MIAEVTVRIELDDDQTEDGLEGIVAEIKDDAVSFLSQYGDIAMSSVRVFDGETIILDTAAVRTASSKPRRERPARQVEDGGEDPDARFVVDIPQGTEPATKDVVKATSGRRRKSKAAR